MKIIEKITRKANTYMIKSLPPKLNEEKVHLFETDNQVTYNSSKTNLMVTIHKLNEVAKERGELIDFQDKQLKEYAFINSHLLRGPVLTLKGLINLMDISSLDEEETIKEYINYTVQKLDDIIIKISSTLNSHRVLNHNSI